MVINPVWIVGTIKEMVAKLVNDLTADIDTSEGLRVVTGIKR